jgi:hypothetical protein
MKSILVVAGIVNVAGGDSGRFIDIRCDSLRIIEIYVITAIHGLPEHVAAGQTGRGYR